MTGKFWINLTRCWFARSAPILRITALSISGTVQYRCAKMSVDMRVARDRVALFLSVSVSKISLSLSLVFTSWSSSQRATTKRTGRTEGESLLRPSEIDLRHSRLGKKREEEDLAWWDATKIRERHERRKDKTHGKREGGFTAEKEIVKLLD